MPGPAPKPPSKRRRANPPKSYGAASATIAPAAGVQPSDLGFDGPVHKLVADMWAALAESAESRFFSAADWERARFELWFANSHMTSGEPISGAVWAVVQHGLNAMLVSPAEKRRAGIELKPPVADPDENAAILQMVKYQSVLKP